MKNKKQNKLSYIVNDQYKFIKVDLEELIEATPCEIVSKLYLEMELENNKAHPFNIEVISIPGNFWKEENCFEKGIFELLEIIEDKLHIFLSKCICDNFFKKVVSKQNWNWTRSETENYFRIIDSYDSLYDYITEHMCLYNEGNSFTFKWFFIKLYRYHNIVDNNYKINESLNLGKMQRDVTIDSILLDL